jgi:hypothetical protein
MELPKDGSDWISLGAEALFPKKSPMVAANARAIFQFARALNSGLIVDHVPETVATSRAKRRMLCGGCP